MVTQGQQTLLAREDAFP